MIITRSIEFAMGHRLQHHEGLCKHVHGHNYKVTVEVHADELDTQGMVMDFSDLKAEMENVFKKYDHAFVCEIGDPFSELQRYAWEGGVSNHRLGMGRIIEIGAPPTAECLAKHWLGELDAKIGDGGRNCYVVSVTVHESSTTSARYINHASLLPNR
jgi:queuosine biosynthesis protein QueD